MTTADARQRIEQASQQLAAALMAHIDRGDGLCIIKAPPGSGKTYTLLQAAVHALSRNLRVAVAGQTNAQCDDICRRLVRDYPGTAVWRFASRDSSPPAGLPDGIYWARDKNELPEDSCVVVSTTAKWSLVRIEDPFDILFVDEAWQMSWSDFMLLQQVAGRFVLIGDPGQIPPVVTIQTHRWETSPRAPHLPAPQLLLGDPGVEKLALELPSCRRLPADSVELVRPFYDFPFDAWALLGQRCLNVCDTKKREAVDSALDLLANGTASIATLPTPDGGPPLEYDLEIAALAARLAVRALERNAQAIADDDDDSPLGLEPNDIGIAATHRVMNTAILQALPIGLRDQESGIRVDTPERWQGLERKMMIVVHPLSGVIQPSSFDLETGRLCVMASRHQSGLILVGRDHIADTLDMLIPSADQALGRPDVSGRGHWQNLNFWETLKKAGQIIRC